MRNLLVFDGKAVKTIAAGYDPNIVPYESTDISDISPEAEKLVRDVSYLSTAIRLRAEAVASLPRIFYDERDRVVTESDKRYLPLAWHDLLYRTVFSLDVYGAAYWLKLRNRGGDVIGARWLDTTSITARVDSKRGLYAFVRQAGATAITFDVENGKTRDLVYFWRPGLRETEPGTSLVEYARLPAEVLRAINRYADIFFDQGAVPLTLLVVPPSTSESEKTRLESRFNAIARGIRNAFRAIALRANVEVKNIGATPQNLAMRELAEMTRENIFAVFGIPASIVLSNAANYATARQDAQNFIERTIVPLADWIASVINEQLLDDIGLRIAFDYASLPALSAHEQEVSSAFLNYVNAGLTHDQAAGLLNIVIPETDTNAVASKSLVVPNIGFTVKADDERERVERALRNDLQAYLEKQLEQIIAAAKRGEIFTAFDDDKLTEILLTRLIDAALADIDNALQPFIIMNLGFNKAAIDDEVVAFVREYVATFAYQGARDKGLAAIINSTSRKIVQDKVSAWLQRSEPISTLIAELATQFGARRAEDIAVTEVTNAVNGARIRSWQALNRQIGRDIVVGKRWITANDERVCPICAPLGGLLVEATGSPRPASREKQQERAVTAGLGDAFIHPGGNGPASVFAGQFYVRPPAHPRCRCTVAPVIAYEQRP